MTINRALWTMLAEAAERGVGITLSAGNGWSTDLAAGQVIEVARAALREAPPDPCPTTEVAFDPVVCERFARELRQIAARYNVTALREKYEAMANQLDAARSRVDEVATEATQHAIANSAAVVKLTDERDEARYQARERTRERDANRAALNRIADQLHVVHEDPRIEAEVDRVLRMASAAAVIRNMRFAVDPRLTRAERRAFDGLTVAYDAWKYPDAPAPTPAPTPRAAMEDHKPKSGHTPLDRAAHAYSEICDEKRRLEEREEVLHKDIELVRAEIVRVRRAVEASHQDLIDEALKR